MTTIKHKLSITLILLTMFLATQGIGLYVVSEYTEVQQTIIDPATGTITTINQTNDLPFGLEPPENEAAPNLLSLVLAFAFALVIISILMKYKLKLIIKGWFLLVITLALAVTLNAVLKDYSSAPGLLAILISTPLAALKIFKPHVLTHNITELLIYPGIAAVFVPILTPISIIVLLVLISLYDMWAVWKSGIMQKMAKFQMDELKIFGGFLIPSVSSRVRKQIRTIKQTYKNKKIPKKIKEKKFKINFAILGGGDVVFPIITAGVFMRAFGITPALFVVAGAFFGLTGLFIISKKQAYPAMPYITTGIFAGLLIWRLFFF